MSTPDEDIEHLRDALGARNDAHLAEIMGYSRGTISAWRARGHVPKAAKAKARSLAPYAAQSRDMTARFACFDGPTREAGLMLALYLAPSCDAVGNRFAATAYNGALAGYAKLFREIELACTEEIAARMTERGLSAVDALNTFGLGAVDDVYERVISRANWWRDGYAAQETEERVLHDRRLPFRGKDGA